MHEPQFIGVAVRLTYSQGLAIGLALLMVFGVVTAGIAYLQRKGVNQLVSVLVFGVIVTSILFLTGWPR
jgi:hypothetical protein